ncbi:MAG: type I-E CRISPR-associated protein Cse2/CasB [Azospirillaceae bacterium]
MTGVATAEKSDNETSDQLKNTLRYLASRMYAKPGPGRSKKLVGPGALASLRRMTPDDLDSLSLPELRDLIVDLEERLPPGSPHLAMVPGEGWRLDHMGVKRWALLIGGMARMSPLHYNQNGQSLGKALALTGYSEERFVRLLRHAPDTSGFADAWRRATDWLAIHAMAISWSEVHDLILRTDNPDEVRRQVAMSYFSQAEREQRKKKT